MQHLQSGVHLVDVHEKTPEDPLRRQEVPLRRLQRHLQLTKESYFASGDSPDRKSHLSRFYLSLLAYKKISLDLLLRKNKKDKSNPWCQVFITFH